MVIKCARLGVVLLNKIDDDITPLASLPCCPLPKKGSLPPKRFKFLAIPNDKKEHL